MLIYCEINGHNCIYFCFGFVGGELQDIPETILLGCQGRYQKVSGKAHGGLFHEKRGVPIRHLRSERKRFICENGFNCALLDDSRIGFIFDGKNAHLF